ncbi:MAG: DNA repair protein RecO [Phycisphaerales bacterium JB063]
MPRFKDQAICIRALDWSETSQIVVMLTQHHGKVRGLAKGARRQSPSAIAKFSGGVHLLNAGEVVATTRRNSQLATVTEWDLQDDAYHLRTDLRAQRLAMYGADLVNAMLADEDAHPGTFLAMRGLIDGLRDPAGLDAALLRFQWRVLSDCGFRPELERDVAAAGALDALGKAKAYTFDPRLGGFTTRAGVSDTPWRVRASTLALLRAVSSGAELTKVDPAGVSRANRLLCVYARSLLDQELATMGVVLGSAG